MIRESIERRRVRGERSIEFDRASVVVESLVFSRFKCRLLGLECRSRLILSISGRMRLYLNAGAYLST